MGVFEKETEHVFYCSGLYKNKKNAVTVIKALTTTFYRHRSRIVFYLSFLQI